MEGAQEPSAFLQWQKEMREKDLQQEQARIERRHLEGLMSHKEAAIAPARIMERNQKAAQLHKEEVLLTQQLIQKGISCVTKEGRTNFFCMGLRILHLKNCVVDFWPCCFQTGKQMQRYAEKRMQEDKEMRDLVQQVAEGHKNSKSVKEKLRKMKQNIGTLSHSTSCLFQ